MVNHRSPYHYGTPVEGDHFTGRDAELAALASRLRNGINVVLLAPRRFGKTSLLLRAEQALEAEGAAMLHVNVLRCRDLSAFAGQLVTRAYRLPGGGWHRAKQAVPDFLRRIRGSASVTFDGDFPKFSFEPRVALGESDELVADVYALLAEAGAKRPAVLALDEFQAIVDLAPHVPALLKSLGDAHPGVSLVLAGSRKHVMENLVSAPNAALYGMAEKLELGPLPDDVMVQYLRERAEVGGKRMNEAVARLVIELASPVPNDIQRLAYEAYDAAATTIDEAAVRAGLERAVAHEAVTYAERYERLAPGQRRVLIAIADGPTEEPFGAAFVARVGLANASSVGKAISVLQSDELIIARDGTLVVSDPFFAAWLRQSA